MSGGLEYTLLTFQTKANAAPQVRQILTGWNRDVAIVALDGPERFMVTVRDGAVAAVSPGEATAGVIVRGTAEVLCRVFRGDENPARAHARGTLQVVGSQQDQIKLDAITLVLWGRG